VLRWVALGCWLAVLPALGEEPADTSVDAGADAGAVLPGGDHTVTSVSANQSYAIRFEKKADGRCKVVGLRETAQVWSIPKCLGTADDLFFISNKGDRFWVLKTLPSKGPDPKKVPKNPAWHHQVVAREYDLHGEQVRQRKLSELMTPYERTKIHALSRHFKWMEGAVGMRGKSPRVNVANEVEFEVAGGKTVTLIF